MAEVVFYCFSSAKDSASLKVVSLWSCQINCGSLKSQSTYKVSVDLKLMMTEELSKLVFKNETVLVFLKLLTFLLLSRP